MESFQKEKGEKYETRKSGIRICTLEGLFANAFIVLTDVPALTQFAVILSAGNVLTAFIGALPYGLRAFQLLGAFIVERVGRRKFLSILFGIFNREIWIPFIILALIFYGHPEIILPLFAITVFISQFSNNLLAVTWMSWFSDLVPPRIRPTYLGFRLSVMAVVNLSVTFLMGFTIDSFKGWGGKEFEAYGYLFMLGIAALCGLITLFLFYYQYEPPFQKSVNQNFKSDVLIPIRDKRFRPILEYLFYWHLSIGVSGVFFTVYMLNVLGFSFTLVSIYFMIMTVGRILFNPMWGRIVTKIGAASALKLAAAIKIIEPLYWIFATPDASWFVWIDALSNAISITGFELAMMDVQFSESSAKGRSYYFAWCGITAGLGFFIASAAGGAVAEFVEAISLSTPFATIEGYHWLFILSSIGRALSLFIFMRAWHQLHTELPFYKKAISLIRKS
ncbi:MAG: MFS transporter [Chloroherpetonaceae bacterium]|nr:MFS transporter [Chloroherpetonaceae bacterium]